MRCRLETVEKSSQPDERPPSRQPPHRRGDRRDRLTPSESGRLARSAASPLQMPSELEHTGAARRLRRDRCAPLRQRRAAGRARRGQHLAAEPKIRVWWNGGRLRRSRLWPTSVQIRTPRSPLTCTFVALAGLEPAPPACKLSRPQRPADQRLPRSHASGNSQIRVSSAGGLEPRFHVILGTAAKRTRHAAATGQTSAPSSQEHGRAGASRGGELPGRPPCGRGLDRERASRRRRPAASRGPVREIQGSGVLSL
jgi:hypothetical protein